MSIPNESLQKKLLQEIEIKSQLAQREINVVRNTVSTKQREIRLLELTSKELIDLPKETSVYEGVAKITIDDVQRRLVSETDELKSDVSNLNKKLHYLETTHKNSQEHIEKILRSGNR